MSESAVIAFSYLLLSIVVCAIYEASKLFRHDEFKIGLIGCAFFMHLSWLVVYMGNMNPFIQPEFKAPIAG